MVCVGDSEDVHLFEVIDGGRDFRKVTTYKGTPILLRYSEGGGRRADE